MNRYPIIIHQHWDHLLSLEELACAANIHPQIVRHFLEYGLIEPTEQVGTHLLFDGNLIPRLRTIQRLRMDMGVNFAGIAVILDLMEKVQQLQHELAWYKIRYQ